MIYSTKGITSSGICNFFRDQPFPRNPCANIYRHQKLLEILIDIVISEKHGILADDYTQVMCSK
jgi:hypothetical protein